MTLLVQSRGFRRAHLAGRPAGWAASALVACVLAATLGCMAGEAGATILTFDQARNATGTTVIPIQAGAAVPQDYGDRVTGSPMAVAGGAFTYGEAGEGFTPNVVVDYFSGGNVSLWTIDYGDLANVIFASPGSQVMNVRLTADPGFEVRLFHFDLAGWPQADYTINGVSVSSGATTLFSQADVLVEGNATGPRHTAFDFPTPLAGPELLIAIDVANIASGQQDNIGLDNLRFAQNPPPDGNGGGNGNGGNGNGGGNGGPIGVAEPDAMAVLGIGLALLGMMRRRRAV